MPCVALVHGAAIGSGVEIAAACDFIVATPDATFRTPEAQRGTVGATQRLPRILGKRLAKDLMFTGRALTAEEAHRAGFVAQGLGGPRCRTKNNRRGDPESTAAGAEARQAHHRPRHRARPEGRARSRARGDRGAARRGTVDGQDVSWQAQTLGQVLAARARERGKAEALVTPRRPVHLRRVAGKGEERRRLAAGARHPQGRPRRHPDGQRRALAVALLRRGADRRGDRAGQHALQGGGDRLLPEAGGLQGAVLRRALPEHRFRRDGARDGLRRTQSN